MASPGYPAGEMGPRLRSYVERQLLMDLEHYGIVTEGLSFDWSNPCQEGHRTEYLDGALESMSDVAVLGPDREPVAAGWVDFIHGDRHAPLFAFWLFLAIRLGDTWREVKKEPVIPPHLWDRLPDRSKDLCATEDRYDATWHRDPLVVAWVRSRHRRDSQARG